MLEVCDVLGDLPAEFQGDAAFQAEALNLSHHETEYIF